MKSFFHRIGTETENPIFRTFFRLTGSATAVEERREREKAEEKIEFLLPRLPCFDGGGAAATVSHDGRAREGVDTPCTFFFCTKSEA